MSVCLNQYVTLVARPEFLNIANTRARLFHLPSITTVSLRLVCTFVEILEKRMMGPLHCANRGRRVGNNSCGRARELKPEGNIPLEDR